MSKQCEKCGANLSGGEKFCTKCGAEVKKEETTIKSNNTIEMKQLLFLLISIIPFISIFVSIVIVSSKYDGDKISTSVFDMISGKAFNGDFRGFPDDNLPILIFGIIVFLILYIAAAINVLMSLYQLTKGDTLKFLKKLRISNYFSIITMLLSAIIIDLDVLSAAEWNANFHVPIALVILIILSIVNIAIINRELPNTGDYYSNINLKKI